MNWFHVSKKIFKKKCQFLVLGERFCRLLERRENYAMMIKDKTVMHIPGTLKYLCISDLKDFKEDLASYGVSQVASITGEYYVRQRESELHYLKFAIIVNTPEFVCNEKSNTIFFHNCYFTLTRFLVFVLLCWNNCKKLDHWRCLLCQGALLGIWLTSAVIQEAQIKFYMKSQLQLFQILSIDSFPTHGWFWSQNVTKCLVWDMSHD